MENKKGTQNRVGAILSIAGLAIIFVFCLILLLGTTPSEKHKGKLEIMTIDAVSGEALEGAEVRIWNEDKNFISEYKTSDKHGKIKITKLEEGKYYICEINAPKGYSINKNIQEIDVTKNNTAVANIEHKKNTKTATPDNAEKELPNTNNQRDNYISTLGYKGPVNFLFCLAMFSFILIPLIGIVTAVLQLCGRKIKITSLISALASFYTFIALLLYATILYCDCGVVTLIFVAILSSIGGILSLAGLKNALQ